jgi:hypothetical protein
MSARFRVSAASRIIPAARSHTGRACRQGRVADQDRGIHQRHEVRTWAAGEADWVRKWKGQVETVLRHRNGEAWDRRTDSMTPRLEQRGPWRFPGISREAPGRPRRLARPPVGPRSSIAAHGLRSKRAA